MKTVRNKTRPEPESCTRTTPLIRLPEIFRPARASNGEAMVPAGAAQAQYRLAARKQGGCGLPSPGGSPADSGRRQDDHAPRGDRRVAGRRHIAASGAQTNVIRELRKAVERLRKGGARLGKDRA